MAEEFGAFGDDEAARGFPVEAVGEFGFGPFRAGLAQSFDEAEGDAAAAVDGQIGGLVQDEHGLVFEQDAVDEALPEFFRWLAGGCRVAAAVWRDSDFVPRREPGFGFAAALVDPHLAAADEAVDPRSRQALEFPQQEVVKPLPRLPLGHRNEARFAVHCAHHNTDRGPGEQLFAIVRGVQETPAMENCKEYLSRVLGAALRGCCGLADAEPNVIGASRPEFGDYQANGVMAAAGRCGRKPRELATAVVAGLVDREGWIASAEVAGPGFINIRLDDRALLARGNEALAQPRALIPPARKRQKVVVDHSSPNLAKEMHVGHIRGTVIGDCLSRVFERLGHEVIRQNHVGDWGTQFGMLIAHLRGRGGDSGALEAELADLEGFYRDAKNRFDSEPEFAARARASVVKLQSGDPEYLAAWRRFIDESLRHCQRIYQRLGVGLTLADLDAESRYNDDLAGIIGELDEKGLLRESEGARCVFPPEFHGKDGEPLPVIVQKSDGGYLYSTTDLAAVKLRAFELKADRSLYVVDARQSLHFQQVFAVARMAGMAPETLSLEHIAYGTIMGQDGKPYKTRTGDAVKLADLLDEAVARALTLVTGKNPGLEEGERRRIAETVGIAAVKYADLSKNRMSDYMFDWATMLSFEGNTAPYLLYACTRIKSLLRRSGSGGHSGEMAGLTAPEERALLLKALQLPEAVDVVARECYPNLLCNYLFELAGVFMRFYESCPILTAEAETRDSRLALARLAEEALEQGLDLLGIGTLERM